MPEVAIVRNGKQAKVVDLYLSDFLADGWELADAKQVEGDDHPKVDPAGDTLELTIIESKNKDDVEKLIKDLYGVDLDKRLSLDNMKERALAVINESKRVD